MTVGAVGVMDDAGFSCCGAGALEHVGFSSCGSQALVLVQGVSCSVARGIFLDQGSNLCLLHWQADSLPLSYQGSLACHFHRCFVLSSSPPNTGTALAGIYEGCGIFGWVCM